MNESIRKTLLPVLLLALLAGGCTSYPDTVTPVTGFDVDRYLGTWYEIARLDHSFERGLSHVTADYSLRDDGGLRVVNRGFSRDSGEWESAEGRAYFVRDPGEGYLKVSFFGPFYGAYVVFELDRENYQYAFVSGPNTDYLWLLAREPVVEPALVVYFRELARERGFDLAELILVDQARDPDGRPLSAADAAERP
jgi:apolipoprotein D and lipocalin family protein